MSLENTPALQLLTELLAIPAPPGREEKIAAYIHQKASEFGFSPEIDPAGNVLVRLPAEDPSQPLVVLAAHMDEIGLVITRIEPDGRLRVQRSGGLLPHKVGERPVTIIGDYGTTTGIISLGSGHGEASQAGTWDDAVLTTGLPKQALGELGIRPGSSAVPSPEGRGPVIFGDASDPLLAAWTLDDRLGVVALLLLLESLSETKTLLPQPTIIAFTVHEEGGAHGAKVLAHREQPEIFLAVDGCPVTAGSGLELDGCPVAWSKDGKGHYDQRLIRSLSAAAQAAGTTLRTAVLAPGIFSDASAVLDCGGAPRVGVLGHARENSHGFEITRFAVVNRVVSTLQKFLEAGSH